MVKPITLNDANTLNLSQFADLQPLAEQRLMQRMREVVRLHKERKTVAPA
ncbi:hypothetical protein [Caballeronia arationis]|nr:hypothetical protein [Caballeronia arationis]